MYEAVVVGGADPAQSDRGGPADSDGVEHVERGVGVVGEHGEGERGVVDGSGVERGEQF